MSYKTRFKLSSVFLCMLFSLNGCSSQLKQSSNVSAFGFRSTPLSKLVKAINQVERDEGLHLPENTGKKHYFICGSKETLKERSLSLISQGRYLVLVSFPGHYFINSPVFVFQAEMLSADNAKGILRGCLGTVRDKKIAPLLLAYLATTHEKQYNEFVNQSNSALPSNGQPYHEQPESEEPESEEPEPNNYGYNPCKPIKAFQIMGLNPNQNLDLTTLTKRWKELQLVTHPDKVGNSPEAVAKTQELNNAYEAIKNWLVRN